MENTMNHTLGERFLENATLIQRAGDPVSSLFFNEKTRRIDIIEPYFEEWGRHDYSVRYNYSLASLDAMTYEMIVTVSLYSCVFIIISFLLIFFLFNYFISSPIGELTKGVRNMNKETLGYEVKIKSKDEIGELATAFNTMSADLKVSRDHLEEYSKNLEKLVTERTKELEEKTKHLEQINQDLLVARKKLNSLNKNLEKRYQSGQKKWKNYSSKKTSLSPNLAMI